MIITNYLIHLDQSAHLCIRGAQSVTAPTRNACFARAMYKHRLKSYSHIELKSVLLPLLLLCCSVFVHVSSLVTWVRLLKLSFYNLIAMLRDHGRERFAIQVRLTIFISFFVCVTKCLWFAFVSNFCLEFLASSQEK